MALSNDLISQFIKATNDTEKPKTETTVYGTIKYDGKYYVQLDGSDLLTPVQTTTDVEDGERVTVTIKDHTATVTGNLSSPSARTDTVKEIGKQVAEFDTVIADKVSTIQLEAEKARIDELYTTKASVEKLTAVEAEIGTLKASDAEITGTLKAKEAEIEELKTKKLDAESANITFATIDELEANYATIEGLKATNGDIYNLKSTYATIDFANIDDAAITNLTAKQAFVDNLKAKYANIDFSNIEMAAIQTLFNDSGIIKDLVVSEGRITGELVGVTIRGDRITAGTLTADKLVVRGTDGLYYKLNLNPDGTTITGVDPEDLQNGLHGSHIISKSIVAEKIAVNDLVAFGATIGGINIGEGSIYSGTKSSANSNIAGFYLGKDGQMSVGDGTNYIRYIKQNGTSKIEIAANEVCIGAHKKTVEATIDEKVGNINIGSKNLIRRSENLLFTGYYFTGELLITYDNVGDIRFLRGASGFAAADDGLIINTSATVSDDGVGNIIIK